MVEFETLEPDWLTFPEALRRVGSAVSPRPSVEMPLGDSLGLALADPIVAGLTLPPGPTSHMDGYALRAADVTLTPGAEMSEPLSVLGSARPGEPFEGALPPGRAARIMTGALLPSGADTVVPVEATDREGTRPGSVRIRRAPDGKETARLGRYVRPPGEEMTAGDALAAEGASITPQLLTLLAATGEPTVRVRPAPRIALIVTGDELVEAGDRAALQGGVFRVDIISPSLPPLVERAGGISLPPLRAGDDAGELEAALSGAASRADLIVTTGGASMGEADLVKRVLDEMGFELDFWRVLMRPGSPVSLGSLPGPGDRAPVPVLSLPGNPVSALVTFLTLGYPAVRALGGHARRHLPSVQAVARSDFGGPPRLTRFFRVRLETEPSGACAARLSADQGSGVIRSMAMADGLAVVREGTAAVREGEPVRVVLLPDLTWSAAP